jgi:hypothetical protein
MSEREFPTGTMIKIARMWMSFAMNEEDSTGGAKTSFFV